MKGKRAVFLDRDGTINVEKDYLIDPTEFEFIAGVPQALKRLQDAGFLLLVVTNQSGVARGYFSLEDVERLHRHMCDLLAQHGVQIARIEICPHHPTAGQGEFVGKCSCRKGRPGMLLRAAEALDIDLAASYMIGDKEADLQAGAAAGCQPILVRTGYGERFVSVAEQYEALVCVDLPSAVEAILSSL